MRLQQTRKKTLSEKCLKPLHTFTLRLGNTFKQLVDPQDLQNFLKIIFYDIQGNQVKQDKVDFAPNSDVITITVPQNLYLKKIWRYNYMIDNGEQQIVEKGTRVFVNQTDEEQLEDEWDKQQLIIRIDVLNLPEDIYLSMCELNNKNSSEREINLKQIAFQCVGQTTISLETKDILFKFQKVSDKDDSFANLNISIQNLLPQSNYLMFHLKQGEVNQLLDRLQEQLKQKKQVDIALQDSDFKCSFYQIADFVNQSEQEVLKIQNQLTEANINKNQDPNYKLFLNSQQVLNQKGTNNKAFAQSLDALIKSNQQQQQTLEELLNQNEKQYTKVIDDQHIQVIKFQGFFKELEQKQNQSKKEQIQPLINEVNQIFNLLLDHFDQKKIVQDTQEKSLNQRQIILDQQETLAYMEDKIRKLQEINKKLVEKIQSLSLAEQFQKLRDEIQNFSQQFKNNQNKLEGFYSNQQKLAEIIASLENDKIQLNIQIQELKEQEGFHKEQIKCLTEENERKSEIIQSQIQRIILFIRKVRTLQMNNQKFQEKLLQQSKNQPLSTSRFQPTSEQYDLLATLSNRSKIKNNSEAMIGTKTLEWINYFPQKKSLAGEPKQAQLPSIKEKSKKKTLTNSVQKQQHKS